MSFNEVICLVTWCCHYWYFQCDSLSVRVRFIVQSHISGICLAHFFPDILIGISARPLSSQFDQFSEYTFVSLWLCWGDSCRTLLPGPHPSQQTLLKRARLDLDTDAQSSIATHAFPSELMTTVWPLKTEQNNLKIDKLRLACTEPVRLFQAGTHRIARISWSVKQIESNTLQFITQMWKSATV